MKSKAAVLPLLGLLALLAMTVVLYGHHSFAATYNEAKTIEIKGKIVVFSFRNPHSFITVEVTDEKGKKVTGEPDKANNRIAIIDVEGKSIRVLNLPRANWLGAPDWR